MIKTKQFGISLFTCALMTGFVAGCGTNNSPTTASATSTNAQSSKTITIGYVSWTEDVALSYLWKNLLEKKGYNVQILEMQTGPLYLGLSQGDIDLHLDAWLPYTDKNYIDRYGQDFKDLGQWYQGDAKIGIVVPKYADVNSMDDLNKHASEFNNQIVGIDQGSGEMEVVQKAMQQYGQNNLKLVSGSETMMLTALQQAIAQHQPIAVTLWSPHWAFAKWPLKYLSDPKGALGKSEHIDTEANKKWAEQNPKVAKWFENFKLTPQQLGQLEIDINNAKSEDVGVLKWIQGNQTLTNSWFQS